MFAIIAVIAFLVSAVEQLMSASWGVLTPFFFVTVGLLCLALQAVNWGSLRR